MMRLAWSLLALAATPALAEAVVGQPAPAFVARTADGRSLALGQLKGRTVVLEWTNSGCPFVRAHYDSGAMPAAQARAKAHGAVWLTVNSSAPGKQGHVDAAAARAEMKAAGSVADAYLLDGDGRIGRAYGARTTPHMFVIGPDGRVAYAGAIDDRPTAIEADAKAATPWAVNAVKAVVAGRAPDPAITKAYGCSVKYAG